MILFKECEVFTPERVGARDVLVAGTRIVAVEEKIPEPSGLHVHVVEGQGRRIVPGLIDCHVHIAGAGGEGGPATRTPELTLSQLLEAGVTTVVGCLGTDGITRTVESVLCKAKALRQEGVSCWIYTGSYQVPPPTILGDVARDLALIDEVVGVGEIAISDHRSSGPSVDELIRVAAHARVGGLLGGKGGIVNFHMGDARDPFRPLYEIVERSELTFRQFLPTHCARNAHILEDAKSYGREGFIDITASAYPFFPDHDIKPSRAVCELLAAGVPLEHITMTSDACGSLPLFDADGSLVRLETGRPRSVMDELLDTVRDEGLPLEQALRIVTSNVADILKLPRKGRIGVGMDADLLVLDRDDRITHVVANGELMVDEGTSLRKGTFER